MEAENEREHTFFFVVCRLDQVISDSKMLVSTPIGIRACIYLLDDMLKLYEAEEASYGAQAFDVG